MSILFVHGLILSINSDTVHSVDVKHFRPLPKVLKHSLQRMTRTEYPEFRIVYGIYYMYNNNSNYVSDQTTEAPSPSSSSAN